MSLGVAGSTLGGVWGWRLIISTLIEHHLHAYCEGLEMLVTGFGIDLIGAGSSMVQSCMCVRACVCVRAHFLGHVDWLSRGLMEGRGDGQEDR